MTAMIVRTADRLFVTEAQLEEAIGIIEAVCGAAGIHPDLEITTATDPETGDPPVTMIVAEFTQAMEMRAFVELTGRAAEALGERGLFEPAVRLSLDPRPRW